ncbi:glycosyltransferase family 2 protein [Naasia lichenicola]|uniref:Glycosyltransferase family 2 protein n=1 Tax=Naasia lichenicola TaxID=2565933 RepID=A0A4S4FL44_9MICO|nr:glycosyltransferase [Naasia lichenicola]THG29906.1 glycosyltransferase family 2 protein [Naasia lichenicola]
MIGSTVPGNRWDLAPEPAEGGSTAARISVVIVHFEQRTELARTLAALARQTSPAAEIIVVDDGSTRPPDVGPGVRLLLQEDLGFRVAAARNAGAAVATGDVLCFLDADTAPEAGYLEAIGRLPRTLPDALVVGRRRHADLSAGDVSAAVEISGVANLLPEPQWLIDAYRRTRDLLEVDDTSYRYVIGAVMACSRWLFDEIGGFDESFSAYGGEDWDFAYRAWLHGAILAHEPHAVAWHDGPEFAGRSDDAARRDQKALETLAVARSIPAPGARGSGLFWSAADVVAVIAPAMTAAAAVITIDGLLAAVPSLAVVVARSEWSDRIQDPRVLVDDDLHARLSSGPIGALPAPIDRVRRVIRCRAPLTIPAGGGELPTLLNAAETQRWALTRVLVDGRLALDIVDVGADRRRRRWADDSLHPDREVQATGLRLLDDGVSIAARFGGWS